MIEKDYVPHLSVNHDDLSFLVGGWYVMVGKRFRSPVYLQIVRMYGSLYVRTLGSVSTITHDRVLLL